MRNYPAFPRATPHRWAGSPRVPHPSATLISEETTFDLHALGTPPALILSQDQTLHQNLAPARLPATGLCFTFACVILNTPVIPVPHVRATARPARRSSIFGRPPGSPLPSPRPCTRRSTTPKPAPSGNQLVNVLRCDPSRSATPEYWGSLNLPRTVSGVKGRSSLYALLAEAVAQPSCEGRSIYHGLRGGVKEN
jgi:hypothetical protein